MVQSGSARRKRGLFILLMVLYPVLHYLVFTVYINADTVRMCFERFSYFQGKVVFSGLANFREVLDVLTGPNRVLRMALLNSALFIPVTVGILLPLSICVSFVLSKRVPLSGVYRIVYFLPTILSIVITTMAFSFMLDSTFGVVNDTLRRIGLGALAMDWLGDPATALPMIFVYCIWAGIGYNSILVGGSISRIPDDLFEYGRLEGLGWWKELTHVVVPLVWPTITTLTVMGCMSAFMIAMQPLLLTNGGPDVATYTIGLYVLKAVQSGNLNGAATFGVMASLVGIALVMAVRFLMNRADPGAEY